MDDNTEIIIMRIILFAGPILLAGVGMLVYDRWHSHKKKADDNYQCTHCGHIFPQKDAKISGWENHRYDLHINCPQCGRIVEQFVKNKC